MYCLACMVYVFDSVRYSVFVGWYIVIVLVLFATCVGMSLLFVVWCLCLCVCFSVVVCRLIFNSFP